MASLPLLPFLRPLPLPLPLSSSLLRLHRPTLPLPPPSHTLTQTRPAASAFANQLGRQVFPGSHTPASLRRAKAHPSARPKRRPATPKPLLTPATPDPAAIATLPYHIHRTPSQQLPVYKLAKRGGSLKQTRVRKVEGDVQALRGDLMAALGLGEAEVRVNPLTGHVLLKVCDVGGGTGRALIGVGVGVEAGGCV